MIEIKAKYQLKEEQTQLKIQSGLKYCKNNNLEYKILTENELYKNNIEEYLCKH